MFFGVSGDNIVGLLFRLPADSQVKFPPVEGLIDLIFSQALRSSPFRRRCRCLWRQLNNKSTSRSKSQQVGKSMSSSPLTPLPTSTDKSQVSSNNETPVAQIMCATATTTTTLINELEYGYSLEMRLVSVFLPLDCFCVRF